jgi:hypothetical protein
MNMIHSSHSGNKDKMSANPINGIINPMMLYFFKIFKVWMMKCDLVSPINAIGFILNPFKYIALKRFGMVEYKNSPASPVRLIKTLPVFLNLVIISVAVSRYFMLLILDRIAVVRGIDHEFFLTGHKSVLIPLKIMFLLIFF